MNALLPYRIISFILLIIAAIFGVLCIFMLFMALINPQLLLPVLVFSSVIVYIITSFIFFIKAVDYKKKCKPALFKWIRTTAFITVVFSLLTLTQSIFLLYSPYTFSQAITESMAMQKNTAQLSPELLTRVAKGVLYFMVFFATTLLVHVFETFKLLKEYKRAFTTDKENDLLS